MFCLKPGRRKRIQIQFDFNFYSLQWQASIPNAHIECLTQKPVAERLTQGLPSVGHLLSNFLWILLSQCSQGREPDSAMVLTKVFACLPACLLWASAFISCKRWSLSSIPSLDYVLHTAGLWAGELAWAGCSSNSSLSMADSWHELAAPCCNIHLRLVLIPY